MWVLAAFLLFDFFINISLLYFIPNNYHKYVYPLFTFTEILLFAGFYFFTFKGKTSKRIAVILTAVISICLLVYYFITYFVLPKPPRIDSIPIAIEAVLMIIFLLMYLYEEINDTSTLFIYSKPAFWVAIGIMLYLAGSLFIYVFASQLPIKEVAKYWVFTNIFSIIKNILFSVAVYMNSRQVVKPKLKPKLVHFESLN